MKRALATIAAIVFLVVLMDALVGGGVAVLPLVLVLFGWIGWLIDVPARAQVDWDRLAMSLILLVGFAIGLHSVAAWLYRSARAFRASRDSGGQARWRLRWTGAVIVLLVLTFTAGTATMVLAHQFLFMATTDPPPWTYPDYAHRANINDLREMAQMEWDAAAKLGRSADEVRRQPRAWEWSPRRGDHREVAHHVIVADADGGLRAVIMFHRDDDRRRREGIAIVDGAGARIEKDIEPAMLIARLEAAATTRPAQ